MAWKKKSNFNYIDYFETIRPKTELQIYNRFIFAICSIHTTWQRNVTGYELLKNNHHLNLSDVYKLIDQSKMGLINNRSRAIFEFTNQYLDNPTFYLRQEDESWSDYAERIEKNTFFLGPAKTRFAIELIYLDQAQLVCTDTHILQWAKQDPLKMNRKKHQEAETKFIKYSKQIGLPPVVARWRYWDLIQKQNGPRYWSYCLENS